MPRAAGALTPAVAALSGTVALLGCVTLGAGGGTARAADPPLSALSLRQLAGQRVVYSYRGPTPPLRLLAAVRAGEAAGVVFFADNITGRQQLRRVTARLQAAARRGPVHAPLLMMVDQEGGLVRRLDGAPERSEKEIGSAAEPIAAARHAGRAAALNLRDVGMNVNLAPVLDVFRRVGDFIDRFGRSYGRDPRAVARLGAAFIRAQQRAGVAATAKHFPGLGAARTSQDTDLRPVRLDVPLQQLRATDERPYRAAMTAGARLVMVSWATYPALDPQQPAGLSPEIVGQELRERLGFTGVTVTDALGAGALRASGATSRRATLAAAAGMDLLLCAGRDIGEGRRAIGGLIGGLRSGRLPRAAFDAAVNRILALRRGMGSR